MASIVIVGAGPAGLVAAQRSADAGHDCVVLEAGGAVGGMAASFEVAGQRVDLGSHRLHPSAGTALLSDLEALLGQDLQVRERNGRIRFADRWIGFPLRATDMVRHLPPRFSSRAAFDVVAGPFRRIQGDSFLDDIAARLGPTVANTFYSPYAQKLYGVGPTELHAEMAQRRVSASSAMAVARRLARASRPAGRTFLYPRRGYGQIVERLAERAISSGVQIHLDTAVDSIAAKPGGVTVGAAEGRFEADLVLSTIPVAGLARVLLPVPPSCVLEAVDRCRTRAVLLAYLVVEEDRYSEFDAHYLPGLDASVARLSEPKNYRDGPDPAGQTVLCAEIPCWISDEIWTWSDADIGALVARDLAAAGLPDLHHVHTEVKRLPSVYPVFEKVTMADRATVERWSSSLERVVTLGRQGLAVPDNLHHVASMGAAAAAAVTPSGSIDRHAWARSLTEFASHVVED